MKKGGVGFWGTRVGNQSPNMRGPPAWWQWGPSPWIQAPLWPFVDDVDASRPPGCGMSGTIEMSVMQAGTQLAQLPETGLGKCAFPPHPFPRQNPFFVCYKGSRHFCIGHIDSVYYWPLSPCGLGVAWPTELLLGPASPGILAYGLLEGSCPEALSLAFPGGAVSSWGGAFSPPISQLLWALEHNFWGLDQLAPKKMLLRGGRTIPIFWGSWEESTVGGYLNLLE